MEIRYDVTGEARKKLVSVIAEVTGQKPKYLGAPTFGYEVGGCTVDKNGTVVFDAEVDPEERTRAIDGLSERGFSPLSVEEQLDNLAIELPREGLTDAHVENLKRLIAGKESLIKKAVGADTLPVEAGEDTIRFPWFKGHPEPKEVEAYAHLVSMMVSLVRKQKRVNSVEGPAENEKYAFRCFLLRLGFIGPEYKEARKILLQNLEGDASFKTHRPDEADEKEGKNGQEEN